MSFWEIISATVARTTVEMKRLSWRSMHPGDGPPFLAPQQQRETSGDKEDGGSNERSFD